MILLRNYATSLGLCIVLGFSCLTNFSYCEDNIPMSTVTPTDATTTMKPTPNPPKLCSRYTNTTCYDCVSASTSCYFCHKNNVCANYPYKRLMPMGDCGSLGDMAWGVCWVNFEILIICMSVIGFLLILSVCVCCCCCCRKKHQGIWARDQAKYEQQRQELKIRSDERKTERQSRTDEIRRKYGLMKDDNAYQRFDA